MKDRPYERVYAEIDLNAVVSNLQAMKDSLPKNCRMIGVVKADGYGHGSVPAALAMDSLVWGYAVATVDEALMLRRHGIHKPVLVLGVTHRRRYEEAIRQDIRLTVFTMEQAQPLSDLASDLKLPARIHLAIDTGMGRIGIAADEEGVCLAARIAGLPQIDTEGLFTHFSRADETDKTSAKRQLNRFTFVRDRLRERGISIPLCHCANSAGILDLEESHMDLVRAGIAIYGMYPSDEVDQSRVSLTPVMALKSFVTYIKSVKPGTEISYGGTFTADRPMRVATVPVGYGDGYPRNQSGKGSVLIGGQRAAILGRVCMDQFMVDVTDIEGVCVDDEVTLIGNDGDETIRVEDLAAFGGGFHYEIVCDIGKRVPRVYRKDGEIVGQKDYFDDIYRGFGII